MNPNLTLQVRKLHVLRPPEAPEDTPRPYCPSEAVAHLYIRSGHTAPAILHAVRFISRPRP